MSYIAIGGAAVSIVGGFMASGAAKDRERAAAQQKAALAAELNKLENSRQAIINPWATTTDMSSLIHDNSSLMHNAFANLGVATQASKFEAEQIDTSLANTLDTLRETGASAGGATALANAALKAKQGISANLEQQEAKNDQLKAQGQQQLEQVKMQEADRVQGLQLAEAQRVQAAQASGAQFQFGARENREQQQIDRVAGQLGLATNRESQAQADQTAAMTGMIGSVASLAGTASTNYATTHPGTPPPPKV